VAESRDHSQAALKSRLTREQYHVTQEAGTEPAFSGKYYHNAETGEYSCICCGAVLFSSREKYDSGSGWPSFWAAVANDAITTREDLSHGMRRVEVRCGRCNAHLGHVFPDGPEPTGSRYCINSAALDFEPQRNEE
jgi:peptide-methionine (R)-S-oxide reductase